MKFERERTVRVANVNTVCQLPDKRLSSAYGHVNHLQEACHGSSTRDVHLSGPTVKYGHPDLDRERGEERGREGERGRKGYRLSQMSTGIRRKYISRQRLEPMTTKVRSLVRNPSCVRSMCAKYCQIPKELACILTQRATEAILFCTFQISQLFCGEYYISHTNFYRALLTLYPTQGMTIFDTSTPEILCQ